MGFWRHFIGDLVIPLRALLVALGGVLIALLWFGNSQFLAIIVIAFGLGLGRAAASLGSRLLPARPVQALEFLELSVLAPATVAATAAAVVTVFSVELAVDEPPELKALAGALATGITTFLTVMFVSWAADKDDSNLARFIRATFRAHYKRAEQGTPPSPGIKYFEPESAGERWIYSDEFKGINGWGRDARRQRAHGVATELRTAVE